jgi:hypothetical protein
MIQRGSKITLWQFKAGSLALNNLGRRLGRSSLPFKFISVRGNMRLTTTVWGGGNGGIPLTAGHITSCVTDTDL